MERDNWGGTSYVKVAYLYVVSGMRSMTRYSRMLSTVMRWRSPTSMLYERILLPLQLGSFHASWIVVAVVDARTDKTPPGLLGGVCTHTVPLSGPTPALFTACKHMAHKVYLVGRYSHCLQPAHIQHTWYAKWVNTPQVTSYMHTAHMVSTASRHPSLQPTRIWHVWYA